MLIIFRQIVNEMRFGYSARLPCAALVSHYCYSGVIALLITHPDINHVGI